jgi:hypothetical protein
MKAIKIITIFVMRNKLSRVAKSTQKFFTYHKGVVFPNSLCSNTISLFRNSGGLHPLFTLFNKFFTNAKQCKQFIKSSTRYCVRYGYITKRCSNFFMGFFKNARLQVVQNTNQTPAYFNFFQGFSQQLSLWFGRKPNRCITLVNGQSVPVYGLGT